MMLWIELGKLRKAIYTLRERFARVREGSGAIYNAISPNLLNEVI